MAYSKYGRRPVSNGGPTKPQLDYLKSLAADLGLSDTDLKVRMGLTERSPWGTSSTGRPLTRALVSTWIDILKREIAAREGSSDA